MFNFISSSQASYDQAKKYCERPNRMIPKNFRFETACTVESIDLLSDDENDEPPRENNSELDLGLDEPLRENNSELDLGPQLAPVMVDQLKIKQEKIDLLENSLKLLNGRIGTEIIDDEGNAVGTDVGSMERVIHNESNVNTLHYQLGAEFGKTFYFITNVSKVLVPNAITT